MGDLVTAAMILLVLTWPLLMLAGMLIATGGAADLWRRKDAARARQAITREDA